MPLAGKMLPVLAGFANPDILPPAVRVMISSAESLLPGSFVVRIIGVSRQPIGEVVVDSVRTATLDFPSA